MIDFKTVSVDDRALYEEYLAASPRRGCEFSFLNVFLWGEQKFALLNGCLVLLSRFKDKAFYSYPLGNGDIKKTAEDIIADSRERGIPCIFSGITPSEKEMLRLWFPDCFDFSTCCDTYDYIYAVDSLADLTGKKYHGKRNHINKFFELYPEAVAEPIDQSNLCSVKAMAAEWFSDREQKTVPHTYDLERAATDKLFENYSHLCCEGMLLKNGDEVLAFTVGSPFYEDMFDIHFEKALEQTDIAYSVINREFSRYIRTKYPAVKFLDREEDMGLEGLRRAKQSYRPVFMVEKWSAELSTTDRLLPRLKWRNFGGFQSVLKV